MIIYQMTHIPTGKIYIGSLKDDNRWNKYNTSSRTVKQMMDTNPEEWQRNILLKEFADYITFNDVVALEQSIIKSCFETIGKDKMYNKGYFSQQSKLYGRGLPKTAFTKDSIPWNKGLKDSQPNIRKGRTFEEMYGPERAKEILEKRQASRGNKGYRKPGEYKSTPEINKKISETLKNKHASNTD